MKLFVGRSKNFENSWAGDQSASRKIFSFFLKYCWMFTTIGHVKFRRKSARTRLSSAITLKNTWHTFSPSKICRRF